MTVRETLHALIEEERQFPHRTDAHLDECDALLTALFAYVERCAELDPTGGDEHDREAAQELLQRAERAEVLE